MCVEIWKLSVLVRVQLVLKPPLLLLEIPQLAQEGCLLLFQLLKGSHLLLKLSLLKFLIPPQINQILIFVVQIFVLLSQTLELSFELLGVLL